MQTICEASPLV